MRIGACLRRGSFVSTRGMDILSHNRVLPFMIADTPVRGRIARLEDVADTIIKRHDYPPCVRVLLAETMVIASMLATTLKHEGVLTLQMKGSGFINMMVVDVVHGGGLRAYAEVTPEGQKALETTEHANLQTLFGSDGYLAITLEPGEGLQRYQGVVALEGEGIADAMRAYFTHSQQVDIAFCMGTSWQHDRLVASGMMIERMPEEGGIHAVKEGNAEDAWNYAQVMLKTLKSDELCDTSLPLETILQRLYHEQGVVVFDAHEITSGCRCSRQRIQDLLLSMSDLDRVEMLVDGQASVHCQFCNKTEIFLPSDLNITPQ